jgi:metal-responsive CopG/Arc/MetJ family transcriptional regulator
VRKTSVYLPDDLKLRLKQVAADNGLSESELIRAAVDEYTRMHTRLRPRFPLFSIGEVEPITDWEEAMQGFGKR